MVEAVQETSPRLEQIQERYRFLARLGSGGMADVFLGMQNGAENFQRLVVIKRVKADLLGDEEARTMFFEEARTVAALNHPHIVKIFDLSRLQNDVCITMEYVDGENLEYIRKASARDKIELPLPIVCKLIAEACDALHYAHTVRSPDGTKLDLIHRDIGPHNLMLDRNGYLKIIDFGIAKTSARPEWTSPGMIKGRLAYVAPEALAGEPVSAKLDVYSLGLVFLELLTRERAVDVCRETPIALLFQRILEEHPRLPTEVRRELPSEIDAVVRRAIAKDPQNRYPSAEAFGAAVRRFALAHGGLAATAEVASWYRDTFAARISKREHFVHGAIQRRLERDAVTGSHPSIDSLPRSSSPLTSPDRMSSPLSHSARHDRPATGRLATRPIPLYMLAITAFVVAGVVGSGAALWYRDLSRIAPAAALSSIIEVRSVPIGASVFVDGFARGVTPAAGLKVAVPQGQTVQVRLRKQGYHDFVRFVEAPHDGPTPSLEASLTPQPATRVTALGSGESAFSRPEAAAKEHTPKSSETWADRPQRSAGERTRFHARRHGWPKRRGLRMKPPPPPPPPPPPAASEPPVSSTLQRPQVGRLPALPDDEPVALPVSENRR